MIRQSHENLSGPLTLGFLSPLNRQVYSVKDDISGSEVGFSRHDEMARDRRMVSTLVLLFFLRLSVNPPPLCI